MDRFFVDGLVWSLIVGIAALIRIAVITYIHSIVEDAFHNKGISMGNIRLIAEQAYRSMQVEDRINAVHKKR